MLLGEAYSLSGDPALIRRALGLFQEMLEEIQKEDRGKDVSTHRLGVMTGLRLAEQSLLFQDRERKRSARLNTAQRQVRELIDILEKAVKNQPTLDRE